MKKVESIFWGIIIIAIGIIFLGNNLNIWNVNIFFDGWWTLFIIIPSFCGLLKKEWTSSIIGLAIGILLLIASNHYISWDMVWKLFIPILLIVVGLTIIFRPQIKSVKTNKKGLPEYISIFSSNYTNIKDSFKGASLLSVFGGIELNLEDAKIKDDILISCISVFGGIDIKLPKNVKVKTSGVPIFGGLENKAHQEEGPTVHIDYVCVFGGVDLK